MSKPLSAIKRFCRECMGGSKDECLSPLCALYPFFYGTGVSVWHKVRKDGFGATKEVKLTPLSAIRHQCRECFGFEDTVEQIKNCTSKCPLHEFRLGNKKKVRKVPSDRTKFALKTRAKGGVYAEESIIS